MALKGREVADAYIEVHGDLSKFRKDLMKAKASAREAGEAYGEEFADGFQKRASDDIRADKDSIIDSLYTGKTVDWDRAFGRFDSKNLDEAQEKMLDFMRDMQESGTMSEEQFAAVSAKVRKAASDVRDAREAEAAYNAEINHGRKLREAAALAAARSQATISRLTRESQAELSRYNLTYRGMAQESNQRAFEKNWKSLVEYMQGADIGPNNTSVENIARFKREMRDTARQARDMGRISNMEFGRVSASILSLVPNVKGFNSRLDGGNSKMSLMSSLTDKMKSSWAGMDGTVRMVLGLIAAASGPMAAGLSGLSAAGTALVSSVGMAAAAAIPLGAIALGLGTGIGLAVTAMKQMKKDFPGLVTAGKAVETAWKGQAKAFGDQWGKSLTGLLDTFSKKIKQYNFGKALGESFAAITTAFTGVLNSPGFDAFMRSMTNEIPDAVKGIGVGLAGVFEALFNMMAAAAPVAKLLGDDFAAWGGKFAKSMEEMRKSGKLQEVFEKARESLLAVLDLTGSIGSSLGTLFMIGSTSGNRMLGDLTSIVDKFTEWMRTEEGRKKMTEWFENGERIVKSFKPLLIGLAEALDTLVTPHSIKQFEDLMKSIGGLLPIIGEMLRVVSDLGILNLLADLFLVVGEAIRPLLAPLNEITKSLGGYLADAIKAVKPLFEQIATALLPLIEAIKKIIDIVGPALVPALEKITAVLGPVIKVIGEVVAVIADFLAPILGEMLVGIIDNVVGMISGLATVFLGIVDVVKGIFTLIGGLISGDGEAMKEGWNLIMGGIADIFTGALEFIWNAVLLILVGKVFGAIKGFLSPLLGMFKGSFGGVKTAVDDILRGMDGFIRGIWSGISKFFDDTLKNIGRFFGDAWRGISSGVSTGMSNMRTSVDDGLRAISGFFSSIWTSIRTTTGDLVGGIKDRVVGAMTTMRDTVQSQLNRMGEFFSGGFNYMRDVVANAMIRIDNAVRDGISNAMSWVRDLPLKIYNTLSDLGNQLWNIGYNMMQGFIDGIASMGNRLIAAVMGPVSNAVQAVKNFLGINSPSRLMRSFGNFTGEGLALGFDDQEKNIKSSAMNMADIAVRQFDSSKMMIAGRDAAQGFADGLSRGENVVQDALGKLSITEFPVAAIQASAIGAFAGSSSAEQAARTSGGVIVEAGAITVSTPATDGGIVAGQMLDELVKKIGG